MDLLFPDNGLVEQLTRVLNGSVKYRLYTNNYTPDLNAVLASVTEAAFAGYANVSQTFANFTLNGVSGHQGFAIAPPVSFSNTSGGPVNVYGYYVTDSGGTLLLAIARFDSAPIVIPNGGNVQVIPIWGDQSLLSS
jgi:hypothetical protein